MLSYVAAVGASLYLSFRYQHDLHIHLNEKWRYFSKSVNLAICYRGFLPTHNLRAARNAGKAAFYCCAFDVITDWRHFSGSDYKWFHKLLSKSLPSNLSAIAFRLYEQERNQTLEDDGLSRGVEALAFVTGLIGSDAHIQNQTDFDQLGLIMQIVDDVLDCEKDEQRQELNCLTSQNREKYLRMLTLFDVKKLKLVLPNAFVLIAVIQSAQRKAERLLLSEVGLCNQLPNINCSPNQNIENKEGSEMAGYVRR